MTVDHRNIAFIGSSSEALPAAKIIRGCLEQANIQARLWTDVFQPGEIFLDRLLDEARTAHCGIFIFSADDTAIVRGERFGAPRDNVVFETGMFMGVKGRNRVFVIVPEGKTQKHILSDIAGLVYLTYTPPKTNSINAWKSALRDVCSSLLKNICTNRVISRIQAVDGQWHGEFYQRTAAKGASKNLQIQGSFISRDQDAHGRFAILGAKLPNGESDVELILEGRLLFDKFLKLDYRCLDFGPIQFGTTVLEVDATVTTLKGEFVGYGAIAQRILSGTLQLNKVSTSAPIRRYNTDPTHQASAASCMSLN
jgi:hypothetical protein